MKSKLIIFTLIVFVFCAFKPNSNDNNYINVSNIDNSKVFDGYIKARSLTKLSFQTDGRISFLPHKKGDYVKKGEVLARLDGISYRVKKEKLNLNNEFNYNVIVASDNGYIEEIYKPVNSYVKKGQPVLSLYSNNKTEAEVLVVPEYINKINLKENGVLKYKNSNYEVKISNIIKNDDNYLLELELNGLYKELKEGTNIKVSLDLD